MATGEMSVSAGQISERLSFWIRAAEAGSFPNPHRILELSVWARELEWARDLLAEGQPIDQALAFCRKKLEQLAFPEAAQAIDYTIYVGKVGGLRKAIEVLETYEELDWPKKGGLPSL